MPTQPLHPAHAENRVAMSRDMAGVLWTRADREMRTNPALLEAVMKLPQEQRDVLARETGRDRSPSAKTWEATVWYVATLMRGRLSAMRPLSCPQCRGSGRHVGGVYRLGYGDRPGGDYEEHHCECSGGALRCVCGEPAVVRVEGLARCPSCATEVPEVPELPAVVESGSESPPLQAAGGTR